MFTAIGDIHGDLAYYKTVVNRHPHTLQVGDFGFSHMWTSLHYLNIDSQNHKVMGGNHDDYDIAPQIAHYMGDYGVHTLNGVEFFFVRGGFSLDKEYRIINHTVKNEPKQYWVEEELTFAQMIACARDYGHKCPSIVISHAAPSFLVDQICGDNSKLVKWGHKPNFKDNTSLLLSELWGSHAPKLWVFGHHHKSFRFEYGPTQFVGLAIGETYDVRD